MYKIISEILVCLFYDKIYPSIDAGYQCEKYCIIFIAYHWSAYHPSTIQLTQISVTAQISDHTIKRRAYLSKCIKYFYWLSSVDLFESLQELVYAQSVDQIMLLKLFRECVFVCSSPILECWVLYLFYLFQFYFHSFWVACYYLYFVDVQNTYIFVFVLPVDKSGNTCLHHNNHDKLAIKHKIHMYSSSILPKLYLLHLSIIVRAREEIIEKISKME